MSLLTIFKPEPEQISTNFYENIMSCLGSSGFPTPTSSGISCGSSPEGARSDSYICDNLISCLNVAGFSTSTPSALPLNIPRCKSPKVPSGNSYIDDILQAVTQEDSPLCSSCDEGISASSRCRDCSELLCNPCVRAHQRVRITKDHRIIPFSPRVKISASFETASQTSNSPCSSGSSRSSSICDLHQEPHIVYCESCMSAACTECTILEHTGHQLVYYQDALDSAKNNGMQLIAETTSAKIAVREAIDSVQRMTEGVEIRSHHAASEVRNMIKRFIATIEAREKELISRIEHTRQMKGKALHAQMERLGLALGKLASTSEHLNEAMENGTSVEIMLANEKATAEIKVLRVIRAELHPCEDDSIMFIPPDANVLRALTTMGNISANSVIMRPRGMADVNWLPFVPPMEMKPNEGDVQLTGLGYGRPIHSTVRLVLARDIGGVATLTFGSEGEQDSQLCRPWGVACDRKGNIIVADRSNNRVQIFKPDGTYARKFGAQGTGPGQFDRPAGVAVDHADRIIVADKDNHRIQIFTNDGIFVTMFGEKGSRHGQFNYPWDVACNSVGHIAVSDTRNHRVQLFTKDGVFINKYGFETNANYWKYFDSPRGVCFNPNGNLIVTDFNNHRLVILEKDFSSALTLGGEGSGFKQFLRPQGICVDDEGRIIVADSRNNRIQVFSANGAFLWKFGQTGKGPGELDRPSGICMNPDGRIVVVDFGNNRVQVF